MRHASGNDNWHTDHIMLHAVKIAVTMCLPRCATSSKDLILLRYAVLGGVESQARTLYLESRNFLTKVGPT